MTPYLVLCGLNDYLLTTFAVLSHQSAFPGLCAAAEPTKGECWWLSSQHSQLNVLKGVQWHRPLSITTLFSRQLFPKGLFFSLYSHTAKGFLLVMCGENWPNQVLVSWHQHDYDSCLGRVLVTIFLASRLHFKWRLPQPLAFTTPFFSTNEVKYSAS